MPPGAKTPFMPWGGWRAKVLARDRAHQDQAVGGMGRSTLRRSLSKSSGDRGVGRSWSCHRMKGKLLPTLVLGSFRSILQQ